MAELNKDKLRQIVRQERQIELYLEKPELLGPMRRRMTAQETFSKKKLRTQHRGNTIDDFAQLREISFERKFEAPKNYSLPIPSADINRNPKLVNNPGY